MSSNPAPDVASPATPPAPPWWQAGVIYEAYLRSFQDSSGDGVGDLPGLRQRLPYLAWLGVDCVWIPPFYPSPGLDFGYDVSDFTAVDPKFGTLADFEALLADAHALGLKVVLDFVPNHTSDQHQWFIESRRSRDSPRRDWYIWRDPKPGTGPGTPHPPEPPNNWMSAFAGSAWEWDEATGQYFYHAFLPQQPDLNLRNPVVLATILEQMRFWLERGVDGFRIDVMWHLIKDDRFRDNPPNPDYNPLTDPSNDQQSAIYNTDRPEVHDVVAAFRHLIDAFDGHRVLIGETYFGPKQLARYYGTPGHPGAHIPHNMQLMLTPWDPTKIAALIHDYEDALPTYAWPNWVSSNHDKPRPATRAGSPAQARVYMMLLLTLRGTPTLYYGDELGLQNVPIPKDQIQDPFEKRDPGKGQGRDPQRTPMPWDGSQPNAGFTSDPAQPWLPLNPDWQSGESVESQKADPTSMLNLTRQLLALRRAEPALTLGTYKQANLKESHGLLSLSHKPATLNYEREHNGRRLLITLNFTDHEQILALPPDWQSATIQLSTHLDREGEQLTHKLTLRPNEGVILAATQPSTQ